MQYVFHTKIVRLEQKSKLLRSIKTGKKLENGADEIVNDYEDMGWFLMLEGMLDSIWISMDRPDLQINQTIKLIISTEP